MTNTTKRTRYGAQKSHPSRVSFLAALSSSHVSVPTGAVGASTLVVVVAIAHPWFVANFSALLARMSSARAACWSSAA